MTSKERMYLAMKLGIPDRVPVMCQLSIGHYFLNSGIDPLDIWLTSEGFAKALVSLQQKYFFDGILINLPGRQPDIKNFIQRIENNPNGKKIIWKNNCFTIIPNDDNPHYYQPDGTRYFPTFEELDPEKLFYIDPWDITGISYPFKWGFEEIERTSENFSPNYISDPIKKVKELTGDRISIHAEIFSPWSQFLELLNYENALMAIMIDPIKVKLILDRLTLGAIELGKIHAKAGADAILISSAFAGGGLISRGHYTEFVLPYEAKIIQTLKSEINVPIYTHTCGSIGDRLDLMLQSGTDGIDTLDPPPLGTVELQKAKDILEGKAFIKGNVDPVNILLNGSKEEIENDVKSRIEIGKKNGGYILSAACSIAPSTDSEKIKMLFSLAEKFGSY